MNIPSRDELRQALADAGAAHHDYEVQVLGGVRDELWAGFYAAFVLGRVGDFARASTLSRWLEEAPLTDPWADAAAMYVLQRLESGA